MDAGFATAIAAGARVIRAPRDELYGDRAGKLADPFGPIWFVATRKEDVSPAAMPERYRAPMSQA